MKKILLQGNEAIALAAQKAGLNFFAGYPITPASEILHYLVHSKVKVLQMEDEIAAINAAIGASLAGGKAMTATSGPGFSLMQEGIGLAHMTETPLVVVDVQRVGPSTGMPTLPAQGDVMQSRWGSHGDYFPIVFYPNSVAELYKYTIEAFNAAEESMSPVILLSDGYISHLYETVEVFEPATVFRGRAPLGSGDRHFTGLVSENGVPKVTDARVCEELVQRLEHKQQKVAAQYNYFEYLENNDSDALIIAYGALSRAVYRFKNEYAIYRPIRMFPVVEDIKRIVAVYENVVVVEMNAGQYRYEIERLLKREVLFIQVIGGKINLRRLGEEIRWALRGS